MSGSFTVPDLLVRYMKLDETWKQYVRIRTCGEPAENETDKELFVFMASIGGADENEGEEDGHDVAFLAKFNKVLSEVENALM